MRKGFLLSIFWGLLIVWAYQYPYQWWLRYGTPGLSKLDLTHLYLTASKELPLPEPFWGTSLLSKTTQREGTSVTTDTQKTDGDGFAGLVIDEIKLCFGEGPVAGLSLGRGDLSDVVMSLQNQLGPVQEDVLLERKVTLKMKEGQARTLVYEWIGQEEGADVYWHETDSEGLPRPIDLPEGLPSDLATFDKLKQLGAPEKTSETHLIQLPNGIQLGVEKSNDGVTSVSLRDEGHLIKCRRDPIKAFACDCLN